MKEHGCKKHSSWLATNFVLEEYIYIYIYEEIVKDFDRMESKEKRQRSNNTWSEELPISKSCI
ncbi:hypothetical protein QG37_03296 [Candidozyma auris]|uniref:Uncharacterized protein n=1 Tax=Candidozyma auris TaxID=498019 RepID=A0A0L0P1H5_CANAR|nr:hypothetical protein QG37_03296 [[Candida] auris]